ncbi:RagB/SusD family nutrient uptake outer membrane protein [Aridibaculum aurantiacum]|uniref:RagB/SusD family nutrient uptake outer membrane protein n=1 Tax=Aridibaculum aurantiacum TaxID=2810307 RepID=UPI001A96E7BE|nr:RagB/SusD family nutrient uptake outer membrane protein [Aridibaculum aurantiacum]
MKINFRYILSLSLIILTAGACKRDLTLSPANYPTSFTDETQLVHQLAATYGPLQQDALYGQGLWGYLEAGADESFRSGINASTVFTELYNISAAETNVSNIWRQLYVGIERANVILDAGSRFEMDEAKKANILGQAKFLRAYYYYLLVTRFGGVEGVPFKKQLSTEMGTNFNVPRTSSREIYEYIIKEMTEAEGMVPSINAPQQWQSATPTPTVVSKTAVQAILARVCLAMAGNPINDLSKYPLALSWAQKVITSNEHALNSTSLVNGTPAYARLFINNMQNNMNDRNTTEGIWDAAFLSKSNATGAYANTGFVVTQQLGAIMGIYNSDASATSPNGFGSGIYRVHNKLYRLYGSGDQRRDWAIAPYVFKNNSKYNTLTVNITGGGGTGATATAYTNRTGGITSVVIDNPGTGYTSAPTITFTGYATSATVATVGTGATATATVAGGKLTAINVTAAGANYPTAYDRCVGKWRREYEVSVPPVRLQNNTSSNFPIIRYSDVLLMAAEADMKVNGSPSATAVNYYNMVRRRAYGLNPTAPAPSVDVSTFTFQDLMDERSRELCFEGVRRQDLIRWNMMSTAMEAIQNDVSANAPTTYTFAASAAANNFLRNPQRYVLLPIPANFELAQNAAITQNFGW